MKNLSVCLGLATLLAGVAVAAPPEDKAAVIVALEAAGYTHVRDVEREDGLWQAEIRSEGGKWREVHLHPRTGSIIDATVDGPALPAAAIIQLLEAGGYSEIRDLDLDDGIWEVEAMDPQGKPVELQMHAVTGEILVAQPD
jgi:uncharacterized membrane protein YkoI